MKIFNTFVATAVLAAGAITAGASYFGGEEKKKGARRAGDERKQGYLDAIDTIASAKDAAIKEQQPYADQGKQMVNWFKKYNEDPNFKYDMYTQYAKVGDPLYDYYQNKQEKALNRQMAARGRFGGGRAIQAHGEQNSSLSAKMAELTDTRVSREIQTNLSLLGSGQSAANNITSLQSQAGRDIAGYEVAMGQSQGQVETEIAAAGVDQISGIAGSMTGMLSGGSMLGSQSSQNQMPSFGSGQGGFQGSDLTNVAGNGAQPFSGDPTNIAGNGSNIVPIKKPVPTRGVRINTSGTGGNLYNRDGTPIFKGSDVTFKNNPGNNVYNRDGTPVFSNRGVPLVRN